jgi:hypothetical protein
MWRRYCWERWLRTGWKLRPGRVFFLQPRSVDWSGLRALPGYAFPSRYQHFDLRISCEARTIVARALVVELEVDDLGNHLNLHWNSNPVPCVSPQLYHVSRASFLPLRRCYTRLKDDRASWGKALRKVEQAKCRLTQSLSSLLAVMIIRTPIGWTRCPLWSSPYRPASSHICPSCRMRTWLFCIFTPQRKRRLYFVLLAQPLPTL